MTSLLLENGNYLTQGYQSKKEVLYGDQDNTYDPSTHVKVRVLSPHNFQTNLRNGIRYTNKAQNEAYLDDLEVQDVYGGDR